MHVERGGGKGRKRCAQQAGCWVPVTSEMFALCLFRSAIENWRHGTLPTMNLDCLDFKPKSASIIDIYVQSMAVIVSCYILQVATR